ncbi:hypothetical protein EDC05_006088 [Coemansia umbellata]|uniref:PIN domain-containing protein n=1 Tax=Coemansia umbellata TaxID=1424467 RepID=A0ABQ8PDQ5_9FUNG|nr:hypothetical protein EDC05_006088 [Coemansia umbellata]
MVLDNATKQPVPQTPSANNDIISSARVAVVIDTNYFIDYLPIIRGLVGVASEHHLAVVVPWVVIQELDGLKNSNKSYYPSELSSVSTNVSAKARDSTRFLENELDRPNSALRCQKRSEYLQQELVNDDKILDCCLYFNERHGLPVVILTRDRNLGVKVRINGCGVYSEAPQGIRELITAITTATGLPLAAVDHKPSNSGIISTSSAADSKQPITTPARPYLATERTETMRTIATPKMLRNLSNKPSACLPSPNPQPQLAACPINQLQTNQQSNNNYNYGDTEAPAPKRSAHSTKQPAQNFHVGASKITSSQKARARMLSDRTRRRSSNIAKYDTYAPLASAKNPLSWENFQFTFSVPSGSSNIDSNISTPSASYNAPLIAQSQKSIDSDPMDVDSADESIYNPLQQKAPTTTQPQKMATTIQQQRQLKPTTLITASTTTFNNIPAVQSLNSALTSNRSYQAFSTTSTTANDIPPTNRNKNSDEPVLIYLDELPNTVKVARESIGLKSAHKISKEIVSYMHSGEHCGFTSLLIDQLKKGFPSQKAGFWENALQTRFDMPPWTTCTVMLTIVLFYWDIFKQVFPKRMDASIRQSLPWVMHVERESTCPQTRRPLPPYLSITPFVHLPNVTDESKHAEHISQTSKLIQLAKRLLAQCALVESDQQEQHRQLLVSDWITWQKINS